MTSAFDLDGTPRIDTKNGNIVDMGCYEYDPELGTIVYIK
jgi:hypothetical protein